LSVLSRLYARAALFRRGWYARHPHRTRRLGRPVISVGNLAVGGSGKTPAVAMLARLLLERGERPAILSRGYGRRNPPDGVVVVNDSQRLLEPTPRSGDEPQMLARALPNVPVLVSADRYLSGRLAESRFGSTVHLLDDGFQHVQLARDVDLVMMSCADLDERVLPWGRLREPLEAARRADALLAAGTPEDASAIRTRVGVDRTFRAMCRYSQPRLIDPFGVPIPATIGRRVLAVAGIARPERFFAALRAEGWEVVREMVFRDHHWFDAGDLNTIQRTAGETQADLVITTEKDAVRLLAGREGPPCDERLVVAYLPMEVAIDPLDAFVSWLDERLALARTRRPLEAA
jgi:tetraacyldisaccharide 4'-kinase